MSVRTKDGGATLIRAQSSKNARNQFFDLCENLWPATPVPDNLKTSPGDGAVVHAQWKKVTMNTMNL